MNHTKKGRFLSLALVLVLVVSLFGCNSAEKNAEQPEESPVSSDGIFTPGTYTGVGTGNNGEVKVEVTFDANTITSVTILEHEETPGISDPAINDLPSMILAAQSTQIDSISGATNSSNAIKEAVNDAIVQAGADPASLISTMGAEENSEINKEADVVVVGGGLAGLSAAVRAAQGGATVILIEKTAAIGGSSALSGGSVGATGSIIQKEYGIEDSDAAWKALWEERQATSPRKDAQYPDWDRVDDLISHSKDSIAWLHDLGYEFAEPVGFGVDPVKRLHNPATGHGGAALTSFLGEKAEELGVEIMLDTAGESLIQGDDGTIAGVIAKGKNSTVILTAPAVILASGGFANNPELVERFTPEVKDYMDYSVSAAGNTGDGIRMAEEVGAVVYEEPWLIGLGLTSNVKDLNGFYWYGTFVLTNQEGSRFTNEANHYSVVYNDAVTSAPGGAYMIFDSGEAFAEFVAAADPAVDDKEVFKADTLEELAEKTGMSKETLLETIETYNQVATGTADTYGKPAEVSIPLTQGSFYAVKFYPSTMGTFGGVKTNGETSEVLNKDGQPIVGLYAAGEMANKPYYNQVYMTGSSLQVATLTGQRAGENAALFVKE